jgi:H+/Cl- antiporter ClcA/CBS domain-containing protein
MTEQRSPKSFHLPGPFVFSGTIEPRILWICSLTILIGFVAAWVARALMALIGLVTNLAFYGRLSTQFPSPAGNHLGPWVVVVPAVGGLLVGLMARYGSQAIRGHGIPEAMEQVLLNQSRIPARVALLKPLSAAIAIGTGGPFGAEGPIIATGGALGSVLGQYVKITATERKVLLAAGAAAGMAAIFGTPVSAVLLAIELLLFEFRPRSIIPVALASATAAAVRFATVSSAPIFAMSELHPASGGALAFYIILGAFMGFVAVGVTRAVYGIEDAFDLLPIHWMWWPALGGLAVGLVGYFAPRTMGVGYDVIDEILAGTMPANILALLCIMKFVSWSISLGSGTSGGTLAPLLITGGALGELAGTASRTVMPFSAVDPRMAALVGMAAMFAGASRATLASVVFAFEATHQSMGLLPLLAGCSASYLINALLAKHSIMTEKIARRGVLVPTEYSADILDRLSVRDVMTPDVVTLRVNQTVAEVREWLASGSSGSEHRGFPIVDDAGNLAGVAMRRALLNGAVDGNLRLGDLILSMPVVVFETNPLRDVAKLMAVEDIGRFPVVSEAQPQRLVGIISRSDILSSRRREHEEDRLAPSPAR